MCKMGIIMVHKKASRMGHDTWEGLYEDCDSDSYCRY